ncbi:MAG TPA: AAA family ATPase, partial [Leptospiraceae bacterium]|nr:AAA family ATPase [Leptospiraceae bacterium]
FTNQLYNKKQEIIQIYKEVKKNIDNIISKNSDLLKDYNINIDAALSVSNSFIKDFLEFINKSRAGTFKDDGERELKKLMEMVDFDNFDSVSEFLNNIIDSVFLDKRKTPSSKEGERNLEDQIKAPSEFYKYLFNLEFLEYNYELKQGNKKLEQLSPGERGALLLIFFLLLDKDDKPLILDQPEDNLDNHSVANILVPFIKRAKSKRQIIIVTHNPNLAIVSDAEQIIYVEINKEDGNEFSFVSGSIENKKVNECIVKVLEGAMPAFRKRKDKYYE